MLIALLQKAWEALKELALRVRDWLKSLSGE